MAPPPLILHFFSRGVDGLLYIVSKHGQGCLGDLFLLLSFGFGCIISSSVWHARGAGGTHKEACV
jgi:hypothetical protein